MGIAIPVIGSIAEGLLKGLDGLFTSDEERDEARLKMIATLQQPAMLQALTNIEEAKHRSVFVAGWRPALGWVCAVALFYSFVVRDLAIFIAGLYGVELGDLPELQTGAVIGLVTSMLGLSTQRTFEKLNGVSRDSL